MKFYGPDRESQDLREAKENLLRTNVKSLAMLWRGTAQADPTESPQQNDRG